LNQCLANEVGREIVIRALEAEKRAILAERHETLARAWKDIDAILADIPQDEIDDAVENILRSRGDTDLGPLL
jgi:hypothetical protein